jgi:hypothetical protein
MVRGQWSVVSEHWRVGLAGHQATGSAWCRVAAHLTLLIQRQRSNGPH